MELPGDIVSCRGNILGSLWHFLETMMLRDDSQHLLKLGGMVEVASGFMPFPSIKFTLTTSNACTHTHTHTQAHIDIDIIIDEYTYIHVYVK